MQNDLRRITTATGLVVLIPLVLTLLALWRWRPGAPILAAVLLIGGVGLAYQLATKRAGTGAYRWAVGVALVTVLFLIWMNAAVGGILGDDPANMMYFGVLLVGLVGALLARLEPEGMSWTLFATAYAMLLVPAVAWAIGTPAFANGVPAVLGLHAAFALLFVASAWLFRRASGHHEGCDTKPQAAL